MDPPTFGRWTWRAHRRGIVKSRPCMVKLAVFLEKWPCKTRLHGSLAKPLIQDNIAPCIFFCGRPWPPPTYMHTRTHARAHARTQTTQARTLYRLPSYYSLANGLRSTRTIAFATHESLAHFSHTILQLLGTR